MTNESHVLQVNVSVKDNSQFWLDYIRYVPLPGSPVEENQTILFDSTDPTIQYGTSWENFGTAEATGGEQLPQNPDMSPSTDNMTFTFSGVFIRRGVFVQNSDFFFLNRDGNNMVQPHVTSDHANGQPAHRGVPSKSGLGPYHAGRRPTGGHNSQEWLIVRPFLRHAAFSIQSS